MRGYGEDEEVDGIEMFGRTLNVDAWIRQAQSTNNSGLMSALPRLSFGSICYERQRERALGQAYVTDVVISFLKIK